MAEKEDGVKKEGYEPEFDVVVEGEDKAAEKVEKPDSAYAGGGDDDERLSAGQREESEGEEQGTDANAERELTPEQIEARRARRRQEKKDRRARQKVETGRTMRELQFLRIRNEQLERQAVRVEKIEKRVVQSDIAAVDGRLEQLKAGQAETEALLAQAHDTNSGADIVKLTKINNEFTQGIDRLTKYRRGLEKEAAETGKDDGGGEERSGRPVREQQDTPDATVVRNLKVFGERHPWVNPQGGDEDSLVVLALDAAVKEEGYNPATKEYWQELEKRIAKRLPERAVKGKPREDDQEDDDEDDEPVPEKRNGSGKPASGPRMASGGSARGGGKQFMLTAARKQALIEAGVWDDPEARDRHIKAFAKWDQEERNRSSRS